MTLRRREQHPVRMRLAKDVQLWELVKHYDYFRRVIGKITNCYDPRLWLDTVGWLTYTHGAKVETDSEMVEM